MGGRMSSSAVASLPSNLLISIPATEGEWSYFFRHIKTTMGMEMLRCKTPEMVRKELRMFIIAHNLI
jgi:hypothetical protein